MESVLKREDVIIVNEVPEMVIQEVLRLGTDRDKWVNSNHTRLGSGSYGYVYDCMGYAVKYYWDHDDESDPLTDDGTILSKLQESDLFPKLYAYIPHKFMIVERIHGKDLYGVSDGDKFDNAYETAILNAGKVVEKQGLTFNDMHAANIMLSEDGKIKVVDVGRFKGVKGCNYTPSEVVDVVSPYYHRATETERCKKDIIAAEATANAMAFGNINSLGA